MRWEDERCVRRHLKGSRSGLKLVPLDHLSLAQRSRGYRMLPDNGYSHVYFIRAGEMGPIKIGIAVNISARLNQMQTGNPEPLVCIGWTPGSAAEELALHTRFAAHHYRGEWFTPHADLIAFIEALPSHATVTAYRYALTRRPR